MSDLRTVLCIRDIPEPEIGFHDEPTDDKPFAFVCLGERHATVDLWSENPDDFRRIAYVLLKTAGRLDIAIERRAKETVVADATL
jgi:hypothetical protein